MCVLFQDYRTLFEDSGNNPGEKTLEDKFFEHEVSQGFKDFRDEKIFGYSIISGNLQFLCLAPVLSPASIKKILWEVLDGPFYYTVSSQYFKLNMSIVIRQKLMFLFNVSTPLSFIKETRSNLDCDIVTLTFNVTVYTTYPIKISRKNVSAALMCDVDT